MREKLIYLCDTNNGYVDEVPADKFADYLIANDVVSVVRCKDCTAYNTRGFPDSWGLCKAYDIGMMDDDFCSRAERKHTDCEIAENIESCEDCGFCAMLERKDNG